VLLDNIDVRKETLYDLLEARILDLENGGVLKQRESATCFENVLYDVYDPLNWDVLTGQWMPLTYFVVTINDPVNDAMSLCEEVDVQGRIDISQEVLVNRDQQLNILVVIHWAPYSTQFLVHVSQVAPIL